MQAEIKAQIAQRKITAPRLTALLKRLGLCKSQSKGISSSGLKRFCELNRLGFQFALDLATDSLRRNAVLDQIDHFYKASPTMSWWGEFGSRGKKQKRSYAVTREEFNEQRSGLSAAQQQQDAMTTMDKSVQLQALVWESTPDLVARAKAASSTSKAASSVPKSLLVPLPERAAPQSATPVQKQSTTSPAAASNELWGNFRLTPFVTTVIYKSS